MDKCLKSQPLVCQNGLEDGQTQQFMQQFMSNATAINLFKLSAKA
jgi:hypothetical protein